MTNNRTESTQHDHAQLIDKLREIAPRAAAIAEREILGLLSVKEAADCAGVTRGAIQYHIRAGHLPNANKDGRKWIIQKNDIVALFPHRAR
ncbi:MAG: hypothetical protein C4320_00490 [Armatimonadota bacterium]